ncbi:MAG: DMT family transporter [Prevotella sp.]|nr:DMT family transporter [Prevotella sp.]
MKNRSFIIGLSALFVANIIWGLMAPLVKGLLNMEVMSGLTLSVIRTLGCVVLFWIISICTPDRLIKKEPIRRKDFPLLFIGGVIFIIGTQTLSNMGAQYTYAVDASVCCSTTPIFTLILGAIFYYHKFPPLMKILGVLMGMCGVMIFILGTADNLAMHVSNAFLGDLLCVLSQVCGAVYLVFFVRIAGRYSPFTLMKWLYTFALIAILPFTYGDIISIEWTKLSGEAIFDLTYIVLLGSFAGYMLISFAQRSVTPTIIAMCNYIQPVTAAIYAILIGMAVVTGANLIATALIFIGVWLVQRNSAHLQDEKQ